MKTRSTTQRHQMYAAYGQNHRIVGFYHSAIHGDRIPKQAIKITPEQHAEALTQQSQGRGIYVTAGLDGLEYREPIVTDEQKWATLRARRDRRLSELSWLVERHREQLDLRVDTALTEPQYQSLLKYRKALRDLPQSAKTPDAVAWPEPPAFLEKPSQPAAQE